jgi:HEAT repeat protein
MAQTAQKKREQKVKRLILQLRSNHASRWVLAAQALGRMGVSGKPALPTLVAFLKDEDLQVRAHAAYALAMMKQNAVPAVAALMDALNDSEWVVRSEAASALGEIGLAAACAVPALKEKLKDRYGRVGWDAAGALWFIADAIHNAARTMPQEALSYHLALLEPVPSALKCNLPAPGVERGAWEMSLDRTNNAIKALRTELQKRGGK